MGQRYVTGGAKPGTYVPMPTAAEGATVYVTTTGSDSNNGLSWATAKASIPGAISALPISSSDPTGIVELGFGTFTVSSTGRSDTCTYTSGSPTVTDASIGTGDVGSYVLGFNAPPGAYIQSVTPGVSFVMSQNANGNGAQPAYIVVPAILLPAGVTIQGRGASFDPGDRFIFPSTLLNTTQILDAGTGITILTQAGTGNNTAVRAGTIRSLSLWGQNTNLFGLFNTNGPVMLCTEDCDISHHGIAGVGLSDNMNNTSFRNTTIGYNGVGGTTHVSGGVLAWVFAASPSSSVLFDNCNIFNNYGCGIASGYPFSGGFSGAGGINIIDTAVQATLTTSLSGSGVNAWLNTGKENSIGTAVGSGFYGPCAFNLKTDGQVVVVGCGFGGPSNTDNVYLNTSGLVLIGCLFAGAALSVVTNSHGFSWMNCVSTDTNWSSNNLGGTLTVSAATGKGLVPAPTTLAGTTAGNVNYWVDEAGAYKRMVISASGYENTSGTAQVITFPLAFSSTPAVTVNTTGMTVTPAATTLTLPTGMGATASGTIVVEGI